MAWAVPDASVGRSMPAWARMDSVTWAIGSACCLSFDTSVTSQAKIILRDGLRPTEHPAQGIEQFVDRTIADGFLPDLHVFPQRGKETVPPQILAQGTQTGTPCSHCHMLVHGALLSAKGYFLSFTLYEGIYPLQECTLAHLSPH